MSVLVLPPNPQTGHTFRLKWEGTAGPPNDVHVEVEKDGTWRPVAGYDDFSAVAPVAPDPVAGFDLPIPPTPDWSGPGLHRFRVRWTLHGDTLGSEAAYITIPRPPRSVTHAEGKPWDWIKFFCWVIAGAVGSGLGSGLLNWWTLAAIFACIVTGLFGGAVSSALGQFFSWLLDDPKIRWSPRSILLFGLFFSFAFSILFGLLAIGLEREAMARGETFNRVTFGVALIAGFLTPLLGGLLNNLRADS